MNRQTALGLGIVLVLAAGVVVVGGLDLGGHPPGSFLDVDAVEGPVPANQTVDYAALGPAQQRVFDRARTAGELVKIPADVDEQVWIEHRYVQKEGRYYVAAVAVS